MEVGGLAIPPLLSLEIIVRLGNQLLDLILSARHRGAVNMVAESLESFLSFAWHCVDPSIQQLPVIFLNRVLTQISEVTKDGSESRRSSGLPAALALIVASDLNTKMPLLERVMKVILEKLKGLDSSLSHFHVSAHVHSLNILRHFIRESRFGVAVLPFLSNAMIIAVNGFASSLFPIRNSSTMVFSALLTRIFGTKVTRDEHAVANRRSFVEFQVQHPDIVSFLSEKLNLFASSKRFDQPMLFPMLILVSRLNGRQVTPFAHEHANFVSISLSLQNFLDRFHLLLC
jgi:hypothetical protein